MHQIPLKRKIIKIEINRKELLKLMPENIMKALDVLALERNIMIKGGLAKIVLNQILKNEGKIKENRALDNKWRKTPDIDIMLNYTGTKTKSMPSLTSKVERMTKKLKEVGFELNNRDIEIVKGNPEDEKVVRKILESRDMTINELALIPRQEEGYWLLYHTDKCLRDTKAKQGILTTNNPTSVRFNYGRMIAIFYGVNRLVRFLTEGKVDSVYLPERWIRVNNQTAAKERRPKLGIYGLLLSRRYTGFPALQKRFMDIMKDLELSDEKTFKDYVETRESWFKTSTGRELDLHKDAPFEEVQKALSGKKVKHMEIKHTRKQLQMHCNHYFDSFLCNWCQERCTIKKCEKCSKLEITPEKSDKPVHLYKLFCNRKFIEADFEWDKKGFYPRKA